MLLEDLDSAPNDVLCSLISIIERHEINVPGRGIVKADKNFRLFVTLRTKANGHLLDHSKSFILDKPWLKVDFKPFAEEEMRSILEGEYPQLKKFSERLLAIFAAVRAVRETSRNDSRSVSLR